MRTETEITIEKAVDNPELDNACKELFQNKEIIAPILQKTIKEYADYSIEEIMKFIDADSIDDKFPVSDIPVEIKGDGTERSSIRDKNIYYDVHFKAKNPKLSNENILIMLHIDFEVQNEYKPSNPSYPISKRAIYYVARDLSSQLGNITGQTNYDVLEKCYSIWVCNHGVPKKIQNTVTRYRLSKEDLIGETNEAEQDYDLMEVIIVRRSDNNTNYEESSVFDYLHQVFTSNIEGINRFVDVASNSKIREEVKRMSGLGNVYYQNGFNNGFNNGLLEGLKSFITFLKKDTAKYPDFFSVYNEVHNIEEYSNVSQEQIKEFYEQ